MEPPTDGPEPRLPQRRPTFQTITFDDDQLIAVILDGDGVAVPVRAISQALGLDPRYQLERLRQHDVLVTGLREVRMPHGGRLQVVVALLARFIPFWLATVTPAQVDTVMRPKLVRYQNELVDVLNRLYGQELAPSRATPADPATAELYRRLDELFVELRLTRELLRDQQKVEAAQDARLEGLETAVDDLQQQILQHTAITPAQQEVLKRGIKRIAVRYKQRTGGDRYALLFAQFCKALGTPRYDALPAHLYPSALDWIEEQARALLPDDPEALPPRQETLL
ncbi:hypothetical protein SD80_016945 [Scytonema tolypothrichoides VB-61278]|nr:hypothetical protein SD80_016945 [Scytonema tolypothrichoides VB-61278]